MILGVLQKSAQLCTAVVQLSNQIYEQLVYTKILIGKSLQSDWVQGHKLSHNIRNFVGNVVIFERQYRNVHCVRFPDLEQLNSRAEKDSFAFPNSRRCPVKH